MFLDQIISFLKLTRDFRIASAREPFWKFGVRLKWSEHWNSICIIKITFYMLNYIIHHPNHLNRLLPFWGRIVLHDSGWWPSWNLAAIFNRAKDSNTFINLICTIYILKNTIYYENDICRPSAPITANIEFHESPLRPSWKMAAICNLTGSPLISWRVTPIGYVY